MIYLREDVQLLSFFFSGFSLLTESLETNEIMNIIDSKLCMKSGFKAPARLLQHFQLDVMLGFSRKCEAMIVPQAIGEEEETERTWRAEIKLFSFSFLITGLRRLAGFSWFKVVPNWSSWSLSQIRLVFNSFRWSLRLTS